MTDKSSGRPSLTRFKDCLRVPPILRPYKADDQRYNLRIHMRPAQVQLHSELPPSEVWTYEGLLPGPTIEVSRGQRVQVEWIAATFDGFTGRYMYHCHILEHEDHDMKCFTTNACLSPWPVRQTLFSTLVDYTSSITRRSD